MPQHLRELVPDPAGLSFRVEPLPKPQSLQAAAETVWAGCILLMTSLYLHELIPVANLGAGLCVGELGILDLWVVRAGRSGRSHVIQSLESARPEFSFVFILFFKVLFI